MLQPLIGLNERLWPNTFLEDQMFLKQAFVASLQLCGFLILKQISNIWHICQKKVWCIKYNVIDYYFLYLRQLFRGNFRGICINKYYYHISLHWILILHLGKTKKGWELKREIDFEQNKIGFWNTPLFFLLGNKR